MITAERLVDIPEKLGFLWDPHRYKVVHGGRGGSKSWGVARALLLQGAKQRERILCTREIQKSIKDSVHRLLSDQIEILELTDFYDILETEIRGRNGTEFIFSGLAGHTVESIKSYEGVTKVWVEEAQTVSKRSWDILCPTIRAEGSEIWVTFNPMLDTDETWRRFVVNPPPDCVTVKMNHTDNPWFPLVLEAERQHCLLTNAADYPNIWEGQCRPAVEGAVYAQEMAALISRGGIARVPYDPRLKVHAIWDMGWNNAMAIGLVQRGLSDIRIIDYLEESFTTLDVWAGRLKAMPYNWGFDFLPHDGYTGDYKTGKSADEILRSFGRRTKPTPNLPVEVGIKAARMLFPRLYLDQGRPGENPTGGTPRLQECLKRYRRNVNKDGIQGEPKHDEFSDGADMFRYLAVVVELLTNEDETYPLARQFRAADPMMGSLGSMLLVVGASLFMRLVVGC